MFATRWLGGCVAAAVLGGVVASHAADAGEWKHVTEANGLPSAQVQILKLDDKAVWVGTMGGLAVFRDGAPTTVVKGEAVWDVVPLGNGRYWVGTSNGILLLDGAKTTRTLAGYSVGRLARFGADSAWAVADREEQTTLLEYANGKWRPVPYFDQKTVSDLFTSRDGRVWTLVETNGLVVADPAAPPAQWKGHLEGINVTSFCEDKEGRIWCGTWGRGMMMFDGKTWQRSLEKEDAVITTIRQDRDGQLWAATNAHGLWQFDGTKWTNHLRDEGSINVLEVPQDGAVYVSSQAVCELRVWTGKEWRPVLGAKAMFRAVIVGPDGKLWAGNTLTGLYVQP